MYIYYIYYFIIYITLGRYKELEDYVVRAGR